jgi:hypothetical protein
MKGAFETTVIKMMVRHNKAKRIWRELFATRLPVLEAAWLAAARFSAPVTMSHDITSLRRRHAHCLPYLPCSASCRQFALDY